MRQSSLALTRSGIKGRKEKCSSRIVDWNLVGITVEINLYLLIHEYYDKISVSVEILILVNSATERDKTFKIVSLRTIQTFTTEKRLIHRRRMREWRSGSVTCNKFLVTLTQKRFSRHEVIFLAVTYTLSTFNNIFSTKLIIYYTN